MDSETDQREIFHLFLMSNHTRQVLPKQNLFFLLLREPAQNGLSDVESLPLFSLLQL